MNAFQKYIQQFRTGLGRTIALLALVAAALMAPAITASASASAAPAAVVFFAAAPCAEGQTPEANGCDAVPPAPTDLNSVIDNAKPDFSQLGVFLKLVSFFLGVVLAVLILVGFVFFIKGVLRVVTSDGDDEKVKKGVRGLVFGLVGIALGAGPFFWQNAREFASAWFA